MTLKPVTVPKILAAKAKQKKLSALTAYDYTMARLVDQAGVDIILVGDSAGTVVQGHSTTLPVTLDQMVYHAACVKRAVKRALVVADMPFMSYQVSTEQALESAGRLLKESGVAAVKLEGAAVDAIEALVAVDIPVMGHIGLTPQSFHRMGGHKLQGKKKLVAPSQKAGSTDSIIEAALAIEAAGAFSIVIEGVPADLSENITKKLSIPTIGIAAGPYCDGQILVVNDLLGMNMEEVPGFIQPFVNLDALITDTIKKYVEDVQTAEFPQPTFSAAGLSSSDLN